MVTAVEELQTLIIRRHGLSLRRRASRPEGWREAALGSLRSLPNLRLEPVPRPPVTSRLERKGL